MLDYWWLMLLAAGITFGIGGMMWLYAASALARVVAPSGDWLEKESRLSTWGIRFMKGSFIIVVLAIGMAIAALVRP